MDFTDLYLISGICFEKNKFGKKKCLFDFEYEFSFEGNELLEITSINDKDKTSKEVAEYFEIILEMFNAVHRYIKEENSNNKMKSYKKIIAKKINYLSGNFCVDYVIVSAIK